MSRVGTQPIKVTEKVSVVVDGQKVRVQGPLGELFQMVPDEIKVVVESNEIKVSRTNEEKKSKALHGLFRTLIFNMVQGVDQGWKKELELVGTGYRAAMEGEKLVLSVGFSHPVVIDPPPGIKLGTDKGQVTVEGVDKALVGQVAAEIRAVKKPEPYKGKGIRYLGEVVRLKPGKSAKIGGGVGSS